MATVKDLETILKDAGVAIPEGAKKPDLEKLVAELDSDDSGDTGETEEEGDDDANETEDTPEVKETPKKKLKDTPEVASMRKKIEAEGFETIRLQKRKGEAQVEFVCLNGVPYTIPRGERVKVPSLIADLIMAKIEAEEGIATNEDGENLKDKAADSKELN